MDGKQRDEFVAALGRPAKDGQRGYGTIITALSRVDVSQAKCRNEEDQAAILTELKKNVGFDACNQMVIQALRQAIVIEAKAALAALPTQQRATSTLTNNLGSLLQAMGDLKAAKALFEEALAGRRATLGDRHPDTLTSINNMGSLLKAMGDLKAAKP